MNEAKTMDPLLYVLLGLAVFTLALCAIWFASCCCFGWCCPARAQRVLGLFATFVFVASVLSIAIASERLETLWHASREVVSFSVDVGRVALQHARS